MTQPAKQTYCFGPSATDGDATMSAILGGKGANLAEMSRLGLPVPPGFTIPTYICNHFLAEQSGAKTSLSEAVRQSVSAAMQGLKEQLALATDFPLLVSVRSGSRASMPGMMDTVLNLGLNDETVEALASATQNPRFAWDSYRRFLQMYSDVVLDVPHDYFEEILDDYKLEQVLDADRDLQADDWREVCGRFKVLIAEETQNGFPMDPEQQLWGAIEAVFKSWNNTRAETYRRLHDIPDEWGTAVTVQAMVFGNLGDTSATGVAFTRNPSTGEAHLYGEFLVNAQGEDVVAGIRTPHYLSRAAREAANDANLSLEEIMPSLYKEFVALSVKLEDHFKDMQDIEFTIQDGKLYLLQTRVGKRTTKAGIKIAVDLVTDGSIDKKQALMRIDPLSLNQLLHPTIDPRYQADVLTQGLPASPGAASGKVVFTADAAEAAKADGDDVILLRMETSPEDIHGMYAAKGVLTSRGGMTSHAAVVARGLGRACVSGANAIRIDAERKVAQIGAQEIKAGDILTIDGTTGRVILGAVPTIEPELSGDFTTLMEWADEIRRLGVRANAESVDDAKMAIKLGADGIGLCRTEHMFFEPTRIGLVRRMILARTMATRQRILDELRPLQTEDFLSLFGAMPGLPITIRLLDPPLHEFLPQPYDDVSELAQTLEIELGELRSRLIALHEANPMLGHRGSRLAVTQPEIYKMQVEAILDAMSSLDEDKRPELEIMVPLIISEAELVKMKTLIMNHAEQWSERTGKSVTFKFGTMIETPRSALVADQLSKHIEFMSFGTNDMTQTTLGVSRDDAGSFLTQYVSEGLLHVDPFVSLDQDGVGQLLQIACERALKANKNIKIGLCGEHGGDPESIKFADTLGMNYVSCSPFRLPIARLAAAQHIISS